MDEKIAIKYLNLLPSYGYALTNTSDFDTVDWAAQQHKTGYIDERDLSLHIDDDKHTVVYVRLATPAEVKKGRNENTAPNPAQYMTADMLKVHLDATESYTDKKRHARKPIPSLNQYEHMPKQDEKSREMAEGLMKMISVLKSGSQQTGESAKEDKDE
ncbi:hypothetical protein [Lactiplantibacillus daowaiensis]|uniref:Uncharacterized protein n=1 Tax=Lactiplantibacillus daowaiensis TaxID=2559918 RepID=A0ABW1RYG3_9LACO|nr:hypothetical protein [Lactiplantibacillus daowaiensis]